MPKSHAPENGVTKRSSLVVGVAAILLGVLSALLGVISIPDLSTPQNIPVATSYYLCPVWASSFQGCLLLAGPAVPSQLAFTSVLYSTTSFPLLASAALVVAGIALIVISARRYPGVDAPHQDLPVATG